MDTVLDDAVWQLVGLAVGLLVLALRARYVRRRLAAGRWTQFDAHVRGDGPYPQRFTRVAVAVSDGTPHLTGRRGLRLSPGRVHVEHVRTSVTRDRVGTKEVLVGVDAGGTRLELAVRQPDAALLRDALSREPVDRTLPPGLVDLDARRRREADPTRPLRPAGPAERAAWACAGLLPLAVAWPAVDGESPATSGRAQLLLAGAATALVVALVLGARRRGRSVRRPADGGPSAAG